MKKIQGASVFLAAAISAALANPATSSRENEDGVRQTDAAPTHQTAGTDLEARVAHGRYLVDLLGCAACHTEGALTGLPDPALALAGSSIGIAYTDPSNSPFPGVVYPPNLTPDTKTGLGDWSVQEIVALLRAGKQRHGRQAFSVMPWMSYSRLSQSDAEAIALFLQALPETENRVPVHVAPGTPADTPFVYMGLFESP